MDWEQRFTEKSVTIKDDKGQPQKATAWQRVYTDKDRFMKFLEAFFNESYSQKALSYFLTNMKNVNYALNSEWHKIRNITMPDSIETSDENINRKTRLYTNILSKPYQSYLSKWTSYVPEWKPAPTTSDWMRKYLCRATKILLQNNWHDQRMESKKIKEADYLAKSGMAVLYIYYDPNGGRLRKTQKTDPKTGVPFDAIEREGLVDSKLISPHNFFPDPKTRIDIPPRAVMIAEHVPLHWAKENYPPEIANEITAYTQTEIGDYLPDEKTKEDHFLLVQYFEAPTPSDPEGIYCVAANWKTLITSVPLTQIYKADELGKLPFIIYLDGIPDDDSGIWTKSRFKDPIDHALVELQMKTAIADIAIARANPTRVVPTGMRDKVKEAMSEPRAILEWDFQEGSAPNTWYMDTPDTTPTLFAFLQMNRQEAEDMLLVNPIEYGEAPKAVRSAQDFAMRLQASQDTRKGMSYYNETQDLELTYIILTLITQHYTDDRVADILGPKKDMIIQNVPTWRQEITDPKNLIIEAGARESAPQREQKALYLLGQQQVDPQYRRFVIEDIVDVPLGDESLSDIELEKQIAFGETMKLLFAPPELKEIPVAEIDDHRLHITEHKLVGFASYWQDPKVPLENWRRYWNHLREHMEMDRYNRVQGMREQFAVQTAAKAKPVGGAFEFDENMEVVKQPAPKGKKGNVKKG